MHAPESESDEELLYATTATLVTLVAVSQDWRRFTHDQEERLRHWEATLSALQVDERYTVLLRLALSLIEVLRAMHCVSLTSRERAVALIEQLDHLRRVS